MYVVLLNYVKPLSEIDRLMPRHMTFLKDRYAEGLFIVSGRRIPRTGGVIIANTNDEEAIKKAMDADPFVSSGAASYELIAFKPSQTLPGLEGLLC